MTPLPELPDAERLEQPVKTFRLVMIEKDSLLPTIGDKGKLLVIEWIEGLTNPLGLRKPTHTIPTYAISAEIVNTAFNNSMKHGNRFNDKTQGAWYCAFEHDTAVEELAYHHKRRQSETDDYRGEAIFREIFADFTGTFRDAHGLPRGKGVLGPKPDIAYPFGQRLARKLREEGAYGIIYPSVRDPEERPCLAAFHQEIVQNARFGDLWKISWSKEGKFSTNKMEENLPFLRNLWREDINLS